MRLRRSELVRCIRRGEIQIIPFREDYIAKAEYPLHLAPQAVRILDRVIDPRRGLNIETIHIPTTGHVLEPGEFLIGCTIEAIVSPNWIPVIQPSQHLRHSSLEMSPAEVINEKEFSRRIALFATQKVRISPGMEIARVSFWEPQDSKRKAPAASSWVPHQENDSEGAKADG